MAHARSLPLAMAGGHHLALPIIGLLAIGIPIAIVVVFFVLWDEPPRK